MKLCKVKGCQNKIYCKDYCNKHHRQILKHGKILKRVAREKNKFIDCGCYCEIILYKGLSEQKEVARTKIDKEDLDKVKNYKWGLNHNYVATRINKRHIYLHQFILGKREGLVIDHINTNKLDNRKQNLRHCTNSQNLQNSKIRGYTWNKKNKRWIVIISINYKSIYLGSFKNEQDAAIARRQAEIKYCGEFAFNHDV